MKLKLLKEKKTFTAEDGNQIEFWQLYLELPSGWRVAIKQCWKDRRDKKDLEEVAEEIGK